MRLPRALLITDRRLAPGHDPVALVERVLAAAPPGEVMVQLREKDLDGGPLLALARRLRQVTAARGALLLINDRLDVALAAGADGVHLPERGLEVATARALAPALLVGLSTHSPAAAAAAAADYVLLGPVWSTPSKTAPLGLAALTEAARALAGRIPLYAVGGAGAPDQARAAREAGAHGIAAIRPFADAGNVAALLDALR